MTGAELADALSASRSRAIATLGKAYIRRTDEPDDELFAVIMRKIGLDDETAIAFLLRAWRNERVWNRRYLLDAICGASEPWHDACSDGYC